MSDAMPGSRGRQFPSIVVVIVLLLLAAAGLRIGGIGDQSLWHDEGNSYVQATRTPGAIVENAARDIHPPGYYLLLAGWRVLTGDSETALRLLSAFASIITVALAFALGRRLYGDTAGLAAGAITTLHSFSLYYAAEARMYALLALWVTLGFWLLTLFLARPSGRGALILALVTIAGLYTHYAYPLFMLAQGAVVLLYLVYRRPDRAWLRTLALYIGANALALLAFAPWLPTALVQIGSWTGLPTTPIPPIEAFAALLRVLLFGIAPTLEAQSIPLILMLFGALTLPTHRDHWRWLIPIAWTLLPLVIFVGIGAYQPDDTKLMLPAQAGAALWIGRGVWVLWTGRALVVRDRLRHLTGRAAGGNPDSPRRALILTVGLKLAAALSLVWVLLALANGLGALRTDPALQRADYRQIAADISAASRPGDSIILTAPNQQEVFRYYYRGSAPVHPLPEGLNVDDAATASAVAQIVQRYERIFAVFWGESERDPNRIVETTLDSGAFEIADRWYGDVRLARYVTPDTMTQTIRSGARFGESIVLEAYALNGDSFSASDALQVELTWRLDADAPLTTRYKVFLQLLRPDGTLAAQRDSEPGGGTAPTTTWQPGVPVTDRGALALELDAERYTLIVGLYPIDHPSARLLTADGGDHVVLAMIAVR